MPKPLVLYADTELESPYAMSAFVALHEKQLAFSLRTLDLEAGAQRRPDYRNHALTARVPCLVHDDFWLTESSAIEEYLDDVFPSPGYAALYPKAIRDRAAARQIQAWMRSDFMPIRQERSTHTIFVEPTTNPLSDTARQAADKLFHAADRLLGAESPNLFGDWSIADTDLAIMLQRLVANADTVPDKLARYAKRQWRRPSVQRWVELKRPAAL